MEEEIEILEELINVMQKDARIRAINQAMIEGKIEVEIVKSKEQQALENLLTRCKQYENKLMFALSPTTHELALETQRNFKKIIAQNIDEDTYTIKKELKKYWNHMDTYWEGK